MNVLACDPGIKGALALWNAGGLYISDMPTYTKTAGARGADRLFIDEGVLLHNIRNCVQAGAELFLIEDVGGMPGQSAAGAFVFGRGFGAAIMAARSCGLQLEYVKAARWKGAMRVPADKSAARVRATELMPDQAHHWPLKKHDGRAEAGMMALYARRFL